MFFSYPLSFGRLGIVHFFTCTKQVAFPGASADSGLLCLGFQRNWGVSVCKNFSPWNKSWKPDLNESRPSLSLQWQVLFYFGIVLSGIRAFATSCSLPSANPDFSCTRLREPQSWLLSWKVVGEKKSSHYCPWGPGACLFFPLDLKS